MFGKIIQGKPIYTPDGQAEQTGQESAQQSAAGQRVRPPQVSLPRVENHFLNGRFELCVDMKNDSGETLFLDKVSVFGVRREIDLELKPGQTREVPIYIGQPFTAEPRGYVELQYRTVSDRDYFLGHYMPHLRPTERGFEILSFREAGPIKDI
jgi:hypothetical protein